MAVSDINGSLPFYNYGADPFGSENSTAGSLNKEWRTEDQKHIDVEVTTLDTYIIKMGIENIDLLKIDVETLEFQVLAGYKEHLHKHEPIIILEILNTEVGDKIHSIFKGRNYSYFNIDESKGIVPVKELGASKYKNFLICPEKKRDRITDMDITNGQ
jgi:hypothetical protein